MGDFPIKLTPSHEDLGDHVSPQGRPSKVSVISWASRSDIEDGASLEIKNALGSCQDTGNPGLQAASKAIAPNEKGQCSTLPLSSTDLDQGSTKGPSSEDEIKVVTKSPKRTGKLGTMFRPSTVPQAVALNPLQELRKKIEEKTEAESLDLQVYDGRYNRSVVQKPTVAPDVPTRSKIEGSDLESILQKVKEQLDESKNIDLAKAIDDVERLPPLGTPIVTRMLCGIIAKALEDFSNVLANSKKPPRAELSYLEVRKKIAQAINIMRPASPIFEAGMERQADKSDHVCELALKAARYINQQATEESIRQSTTKIRSCRLQAMAGLCLVYSQATAKPKWKSLSSLLQMAKSTSSTEYSTSFLEVVQDAIEGIFDPLIQHTFTQEEESNIKEHKVEKEPSKKSKKKDTCPPMPDGHSLIVSKKRNTCGTCLMAQPHPFSLNNKALRQWLNLYSEIAQITNEQLCHFRHDSASAKQIIIPTYEKSKPIKTIECLKILVPGIVDNLLRIRLAEERNERIKKARATLCPHEVNSQAKTWIGTKGITNPTFGALIFVDEPASSERPIMVINESKVTQWLDYFLESVSDLRGITEKSNFIASISAMRSLPPVMIRNQVHNLHINSTGAMRGACSHPLHSDQCWFDHLLPVYIKTCELRDDWKEQRK